MASQRKKKKNYLKADSECGTLSIFLSFLSSYFHPHPFIRPLKKAKWSAIYFASNFSLLPFFFYFPSTSLPFLHIIFIMQISILAVPPSSIYNTQHSEKSSKSGCPYCVKNPFSRTHLHTFEDGENLNFNTMWTSIRCFMPTTICCCCSPPVSAVIWFPCRFAARKLNTTTR